MNYLGLISICLGIIAVLLAINYINFGEKIHKEIKNIRTKCININKYKKNEKNIQYILSKLQKNTDLEIDELYKLILEYYKKNNIKKNSIDTNNV